MLSKAGTSGQNGKLPFRVHCVDSKTEAIDGRRILKLATTNW